MTLYNQCLLSVLLNDGYETHALVHTIQNDIAALQCFKNKLHEWNETFELLNQIQERITNTCYHRNCYCSIQIDCECSSYHHYEIRPECEQEIARLNKEEEDLRMELDGLRKEIIRVKDKIPSHLKVVARKIVNKMDDQWLSFLNINLMQ